MITVQADKYNLAAIGGTHKARRCGVDFNLVPTEFFYQSKDIFNLLTYMSTSGMEVVPHTWTSSHEVSLSSRSAWGGLSPRFGSRRLERTAGLRPTSAAQAMLKHGSFEC
ncbi:hypothetical protein EVAR_87963_1 [Eumeta japonica]|uniref:Uncharacterized protein n=1 Tax=Eumeta variegata TaxID=151549 RepID=A0A4C1VEJ7_EUMVA|nr:hypothetical protein EVAR_87963_1 [Eumeta japonica]